MPTSVISNLNPIVPEQSENIRSLSCILKWRRGKLLVKTSGKLPQQYLASLENENSLIECLKHSPITLVSIDPKIGDSLLKIWADACQKADKPIFINIPAHRKLPKKSNQFFRKLSRVIDWILALFLLIFMGPFILGLFTTMQIYSPELLFDYQWYVGENGRIIKAIKFSSTVKYEITNFLPAIGQYFLETVSNILNVLQGKFSLINNCCLPLEDAVKLTGVYEEQNHL
ncbi:sugar transferase [Dolichospermum sp. FACHB-1091]|uniref:heterocyst development glycosyltransferase HepC n=1 Tax=Dolichospermum sp. FACHB-1091 TaxID=2692798 RepID=UPI00168111B3|nr:heterocyst development glycosyltransferase HepC [Dolichospermum sp. FACHB-1091]MBD2444391.1 sugar transferase [Dolichospermum sp. FACHB-1091]